MGGGGSEPRPGGRSARACRCAMNRPDSVTGRYLSQTDIAGMVPARRALRIGRRGRDRHGRVVVATCPTLGGWTHGRTPTRSVGGVRRLPTARPQHLVRADEIESRHPGQVRNAICMKTVSSSAPGEPRAPPRPATPVGAALSIIERARRCPLRHSHDDSRPEQAVEERPGAQVSLGGIREFRWCPA